MYNIIFKGRIEIVRSVRFEGDRTNICRGVRIEYAYHKVCTGAQAYTNKSEKAVLASKVEQTNKMETCLM